jgi:hypothetical protein
MGLRIPALRAMREIGLGPLSLYARYQILLRSGWPRWRTPVFEWRAKPLERWLRPEIPSSPQDYAGYRQKNAPVFFLPEERDFTRSLMHIHHGNIEDASSEADALLEGQYCLFGIPEVDMGFPPDWGAFAPLAGGESGGSVDLNHHWSVYDEASFPVDVKLLWELSRFGWVYPLIRAHALTGEARYVEGFYTLVDSWRTANCPNAGPHWQSAQEAALRLMALVTATYAFRRNLIDDGKRLSQLVQMIAIHAARIPSTMLYARAQGNNHLLTEALALYTAGTLFPELRSADRWRELGRRWLLQALDQQIFPDGGYVQHSTNYHRLALQAGLWAARLTEISGDPLPPPSLGALRRLTHGLRTLVDPERGRAPNFGPNDGALILPWSTCGFDDYRPVVQAGMLAFAGQPIYDAGPWDEESVWLGLLQPERQTHDEPSPITFNGQGYATSSTETLPFAGLHILARGRSRGVLRCAQFQTRPGHSDQLHFDLWRHGQAVACDPGTYLYSGEMPWDNGLAGAAVHNTVLVDGIDPMIKAGRFLWLRWAQGYVLGRWRTASGKLEFLAAEHHGYSRFGVIHRRTIVRAGEILWLVVDDVLGEGVHTVSLGWTLPDGDWQWEGDCLGLAKRDVGVDAHIESPSGGAWLYREGRLLAGDSTIDECDAWGWRSPTYAVKEPAIRWGVTVRDTLPVRLKTWWAFDGADTEALRIGWRLPHGDVGAVEWLEMDGEYLDTDNAHLVNPSGVRRAG